MTTDIISVIYGATLGAMITFTVCVAVFPTDSRDIINKFKELVCVESTVGTDVIKRCYKLQEVK